MELVHHSLSLSEDIAAMGRRSEARALILSQLALRQREASRMMKSFEEKAAANRRDLLVVTDCKPKLKQEEEGPVRSRSSTTTAGKGINEGLIPVTSMQYCYQELQQQLRQEEVEGGDPAGNPGNPPRRGGSCSWKRKGTCSRPALASRSISSARPSSRPSSAFRAPTAAAGGFPSTGMTGPSATGQTLLGLSGMWVVGGGGIAAGASQMVRAAGRPGNVRPPGRSASAVIGPNNSSHRRADVGWTPSLETSGHFIGADGSWHRRSPLWTAAAVAAATQLEGESRAERMFGRLVQSMNSLALGSCEGGGRPVMVSVAEQEAAADCLMQATTTPIQNRTHETCCICLSDMQDGEAVCMLLQCAHRMHGPCLRKWVLGKKEAICPLCKSCSTVSSR